MRALRAVLSRAWLGRMRRTCATRSLPSDGAAGPAASDAGPTSDGPAPTDAKDFIQAVQSLFSPEPTPESDRPSVAHAMQVVSQSSARAKQLAKMAVQMQSQNPDAAARTAVQAALSAAETGGDHVHSEHVASAVIRDLRTYFGSTKQHVSNTDYVPSLGRDHILRPSTGHVYRRRQHVRWPTLPPSFRAHGVQPPSAEGSTATASGPAPDHASFAVNVSTGVASVVADATAASPSAEPSPAPAPSLSSSHHYSVEDEARRADRLAAQAVRATGEQDPDEPPAHVQNREEYPEESGEEVGGATARVRAPPGFTRMPTASLRCKVIRDPFESQVPRLAHGLERVIDLPGLHPLRDLSNHRVFHFDPWLQRVAPPDQVAPQTIPPFVPPSQDAVLADLAQQHQCRFVGSSSSVSSALVQLYLTLTNFKEVDVSSLSEAFHRQSRSFTPALLKPATFILRRRTADLWAVDGESPPRNPRNLVLLQLGKSLELQLTLPPAEFEQRVLASSQPPPHSGREAYSYLRLGDMLLRSQLDAAKDGRVFDVKTRATYAIRSNIANYASHVGYRLTRISGPYSSFEREFYDMIRSAFIKYGFQARIGRMDGMFVAYHNTQELFGFEYIPLEDIDRCVSGSSFFAETTFNICTRALREVMDRIVLDYPTARQLRVAFAAVNGHHESAHMDVYVESIAEEAPWPQESGVLRTLASGAPVDGSVELRKYRLSFAAFVNGLRCKGQLALTPNDELNLFWRILPQHSEPPKLLREYIQVLRRMRMDDLDEPAPDTEPARDVSVATGTISASDAAVITSAYQALHPVVRTAGRDSEAGLPPVPTESATVSHPAAGPTPTDRAPPTVHPFLAIAASAAEAERAARHRSRGGGSSSNNNSNNNSSSSSGGGGGGGSHVPSAVGALPRGRRPSDATH